MLQNTDFRILQGKPDREICGLAYDSRKAKPGDVFFCISGACADGHDYAEAAAAAGAQAVVCSRNFDPPLPEGITVVQCPDVRKAMAVMSAVFYGHPDRDLVTIGITGTKGKTTAAYMIRDILEACGIRCGLIGTICVDTGTESVPGGRTTPEAADLHRYFRQMAAGGCRAVVMEVSSQALKLDRTWGICFDYGVFTNISPDHIGPAEHESFSEYVSCKAKLFRQCRQAVVNGDDPEAEHILCGASCRVETFGFGEKNDLRAEELQTVYISGKPGVSFQARGLMNGEITVAMPGRFSCLNALAAAGVCRHLGADRETVCRALKSVAVPGRQEMFSFDEDKLIVVDYAHNGFALEELLKGLRAYEPDCLICVFGCGGQRDPERRRQMAAAAGKYADFLIITSDNPRNESPKAIISDIIREISHYDVPCLVVEDRGDAIETAVRRCPAGGIAVIAGKGHESCQIIGDRKIHFDDREQVLLSIEKVKYEQDYINRD